MKITGITATPIQVPRPQTFMSSLGRSAYTENAVVEIETDGGITGIGEICSIWDRKGPPSEGVEQPRFRGGAAGRIPWKRDFPRPVEL